MGLSLFGSFVEVPHLVEEKTLLSNFFINEVEVSHWMVKNLFYPPSSKIGVEFRKQNTLREILLSTSSSYDGDISLTLYTKEDLSWCVLLSNLSYYFLREL